FSEAGTPDVHNLYARFGTQGPVFVIAGHTDVVPPGDLAGWSRDPFSGEIVDGVLHGRGACDMKGGLAGMTAAAIQFTRDNPDFPGSIALLVTGDEEGPAVNGTVKLLEWAHARGERFDHCMLGEPTNPERLGDMIKIGRRGSLSCKLTVTGKQGHVAYPEQTTNPIRAMVKLLAALEATPLDAGTTYFGPSTLEITSVDVGNPSGNVVPSEARAAMNVRFNDTWTPETLEVEMRQRFASVSIAGRYEAVFAKTNAVSFVTEPGPFVDMVSDAVKAETGLVPKLSTTGGTSDARFIKNYCPVVEFGTVGKTMHQVNESVATADIEGVCRITRRVLGVYFGRQ
ncbi:MAG: succinyl-diaminopimelate desuccinylase, partial [Bosea sp. (in: a-proteobacteria)]